MSGDSETNRRDTPEIRFAAARGARIAYQVFGEGTEPVLGVPPLAQNIEFAWEQPRIRAMFDRFGSFARYAHFDKRGTGSSDRRSAVPGLDERVDDLRAVMDAVGFDSAHLFAVSDGGPMAMMFAATYPERVRSLVLQGTGAALTPADVTTEELEGRRELAAMVAGLWGTPDSLVTGLFAPSLADDAAYQAWHRRYERMAADRDSLRELLELGLDVDVRDILEDLRVPTLVVHNRGDQVVDVVLGRELAATIPGARFVEIDSGDHFNYVDIEPWIGVVEEFVTGTVRDRPPVRSTTSVHITTLGRFAVEVDGEEVPPAVWGSRQARVLCMRLAAARGWPVTREALFDLLWPDEADLRRLGARLSVQLSAVRRVLGGGVAADRETVALDLAQVSTDIEKLWSASTDEEVVAAYSGDFLPSEVHADWSTAVRDDARRRFTSAARRIITTALDDGRPDDVVELAHRLVASDQYDPGAHELLAQTLTAAGEEREAELARDRYRDLMAELGIDTVD